MTDVNARGIADLLRSGLLNLCSPLVDIAQEAKLEFLLRAYRRTLLALIWPMTSRSER
jgi:hypothetical protein